jgi:hypothetical protein
MDETIIQMLEKALANAKRIEKAYNSGAIRQDEYENAQIDAVFCMAGKLAKNMGCSRLDFKSWKLS